MNAAPANLDWVFRLSAIALALTGGLLLLWALFRDRSRGRRRCPKCWYDMAGVPGLRCPECGREARVERRFFRTRRRWKWAGVALVLLIAAAGVAATPAVLAGKWERVVPSTVLVFGVGSWEMPAQNRTAMLAFRLAVGTPAPPAASDWRERLATEMLDRFRAGRMWRWQGSIAVRRAAADLRGTPAQGVRDFDLEIVDYAAGRPGTTSWLGAPLGGAAPAASAPNLWVSDVARARRAYVREHVHPAARWREDGPVWLRIGFGAPEIEVALEMRPAGSEGAWLPSTRNSWAWSDGCMGPFPAARSEMPMEVRLVRESADQITRREMWRVVVPIDPGALAPGPIAVGDPRIEAALRADVLAGFSLERFYDNRPLLWIETDARLSTPVGGHEKVEGLIAQLGCSFGMRLAVLRDGRPVARGCAIWSAPTGYAAQSFPGGQLLELVRLEGAATDDSSAGWSLRIEGDADVAMRDPKCTRYWKGSVEIPLRVFRNVAPWPTLEEWNARRERRANSSQSESRDSRSDPASPP